jgi:hypothetical protein
MAGYGRRHGTELMTDSPSLADSQTASSGMTRLERLQQKIERAANLLPSQGPITVFVHHNTLHAFEGLRFDEALKAAARAFGCQPYLSEDRYRQELRRGRIRFAGLHATLLEDLGKRAWDKVVGFCTRLKLRLAMLQFPLRYGPTEELLWFVAETDALRRVRADASAAIRVRLVAETRRWAMRDLRSGNGTGLHGAGSFKSVPAGLAGLFERFAESHIEDWTDSTWEAFTLHVLWRVCCNGVARVPETAPPTPTPLRHRDLLLQATGLDADLLVHDLLIRFCGAYLDQGLAQWRLPRRDEGFYRAFWALYRQPLGPPDHWLRGLAAELVRSEQARLSPLESISESLELLGVPEREWDDFLAATLLALRGWAGMTRFLEERGDRAVHPIPPGSLVEFLAVRLLLDRLALAHAAQQSLGFTGPLLSLRDQLRRRLGRPQMPSVEQHAFLVFQLAQVLGWTPEELHRLSDQEWQALMAEIEAFSTIERRRIFHLAYERRFCTRALDALALHSQWPEVEPYRPRFQAVFCIDERQESIRRHLEEVAPDAVTFGLPGYYGLDMYYRGVTDAHFVPLCPPILRPGHWVVERVQEESAEVHERLLLGRWVLGMASHRVHIGTRAFALGALLSTVGGVLASIPLIARTLLPRVTARIRKAFGRLVLPPPATRLQLERSEPVPSDHGGGIGFSLEEMAAIAERVLRDLGLTSGFARLVLMFGHGSTSLNNPHESAHDCGACGGSRGGPNARAIAQLLNDPRVRAALKERGLVLPAETVFIGAAHNTSSAAVTFYDLDRLPGSHREAFEAARTLVEEACDRDAHERCRRFQTAPLTLSCAAARQHVEGRAEDLAQVRPEWGHATNGLCIVGRRRRTRGLFLDRRAFLHSYDPTQDDAEGTILGRVLQAAVPVCAGISLEYYFSYVDNHGFGCGTKLPHNIASLLGVMDGAASDLRTGLPWQMVEIHEPVRILFVVETTAQTMYCVMERYPPIGRLIRNDWVRLALLDPVAPIIQVYRKGAFRRYRPQARRLPHAASSGDWYRGWRDHLEFAEIGDTPVRRADDSLKLSRNRRT